MAAEVQGAASDVAAGPFARSYCGPPPHLRPEPTVRNTHYFESVLRRRRVLNITTYIAAAVSLSFSIMGLVTEHGLWRVTVINFATALIFATIPFLHRFGELVAPLALISTAFVSLSVVTLSVGTGSGLQFYFLVGATVAVLTLGVERLLLASILVAIGAGLVIALQLLVPTDTGVQPHWALTTGFVVSTISACVMIVATVSFALREIDRAEDAMELEYRRSESLLANILPGSIADRLKASQTALIADKYEDASVLFADIAGYTERASQTTPADLVEFLNRLYTDFDRLVEKHGLEKIKTTGDCYMVVSGVPHVRPDHLEALACLALSMVDAVAGLTDPRGHCVPMRIGIGVGPVVAGVVGSRRFFYDVWGDAVNVASRMESTGEDDRIQVPQDVYERLNAEFAFQERGDVAVKGKGMMHTWFLVAQREVDSVRQARADQDSAGVR
ncbi:MAG: adenylate cyclase [Mycobacterium sp.]|jgi:adenylate cyclase|nr:adenylate cyclase [Mycobacterium sp.]